jgi:Hemerythrin HHE cation binding domain
MSQAHADNGPLTRPGQAALLVPMPADPASILMAVHQRIERQFAAYQQAEGSHPRQYRAVGAIAAALATHVALEQELLYPAVRAHTGRHDAEIDRQLEQNHLLDLTMVELGGMVPTDPRYDAKVRLLRHTFGQHAGDAEALLIPELRRRLDPGEREQLGRQLLGRIGQLEGRPRPGW